MRAAHAIWRSSTVRSTGCDLVALRVSALAPAGTLRQRATIVQRKTHRPVPFELTEPTRQALAVWLEKRGGRLDDWLDRWLRMIDLGPRAYGTHSLRRTKVAQLYRRTGNLRACQLLLGHGKLESTVRYLGIEVDDALELSEQTEI
jgi:hypothetical protein